MAHHHSLRTARSSITHPEIPSSSEEDRECERLARGIRGVLAPDVFLRRPREISVNKDSYNHSRTSTRARTPDCPRARRPHSSRCEHAACQESPCYCEFELAKALVQLINHSLASGAAPSPSR
jgi:hypothetical protein